MQMNNTNQANKNAYTKSLIVSDKELHLIELALENTEVLDTDKNYQIKDILIRTGKSSIEELAGFLLESTFFTHGPNSINYETEINNIVAKLYSNSLTNECLRILDVCNHKFIYANDLNTVLLGYTPEEIIEGGLKFTHSKIHPWDLLQLSFIISKYRWLYAQLADSDKHKTRFTYDVRIKAKDGKYRRIQQQLYPLVLDSDFNPAYVLIISTDISAYKSSTEIQFTFGIQRKTQFEILLMDKTKAFNNLLTNRETEILYHLSQGNTEQKTATITGISIQTIKTHKKNMLAKTETKNTNELISLAIRKGWI
jgi:DNA-binding CsgD family transcriptional regulator/PAS domain-containing protein